MHEMVPEDVMATVLVVPAREMCEGERATKRMALRIDIAPSSIASS